MTTAWAGWRIVFRPLGQAGTTVLYECDHCKAATTDPAAHAKYHGAEGHELDG